MALAFLGSAPQLLRQVPVPLTSSSVAEPAASSRQFLTSEASPFSSSSGNRLIKALLGTVAAVLLRPRRCQRDRSQRAVTFTSCLQPVLRESRLVCRALNNRTDPSDEPDPFFQRPANWQRKVVPAWNGNKSPSKVQINNDVTFFFPTKGRKESESDGYANVNMYKPREPSKRLKKRHRRQNLRAWRSLSNRLKDEWRFKRLPRDSSGKAVPGVFYGSRRKDYKDLRGGANRTQGGRDYK
eukprot:TRINITY_DN50139_c0_g1_i1.p1 TRINITY_DN50139_c0_g1~~TRINITY_DN50139_c0_g1_i1.p1  ORF type:complete len:240 (+),score=27.46 TRINITY_DN50139_c0_g1_i1:69-788(+)